MNKSLVARWRVYVFSVRSAAVLGRSNVRPSNALELLGISPTPEPAAPEDGRTPLNRYADGIKYVISLGAITPEFPAQGSVLAASHSSLPDRPAGGRTPYSAL